MPNLRRDRARLLPLLGLLLAFRILAAATEPAGPQPPSARVEVKPADVSLEGQTLFSIQRPILAYSPQYRASSISAALADIARDSSIGLDSIAVMQTEGTYYIAVRDRLLMHVTPDDAQAAGRDPRELAESYAARIRAAIGQYRQQHSRRQLLEGIGYSLLATAMLALLLAGLQRVCRLLRAKIRDSVGVNIRGVRFQRYEILSAGSAAGVLTQGINLARFVLGLLILYAYLTLVFSFFPSTHGYAVGIANYVLTQLGFLWHGFVGVLPNLLTVAVIGVLAYYIDRVNRLFFRQVEKGNIEIDGFYREWATPTAKIVRVLVVGLTVVVIYPYLPGSDSPAFKGLSIFAGVLLSLGSSSAVANVVAGVILTYMRPFQIGDRVQIGDKTGDVVERSLLVTRIRTIKNVDVTLANSLVLGHDIVNYTAQAQDRGLILNTAVTIGYDVPWRKVHELLIAAALSTEHVLHEPKPFVLQTALDDFFVHYEINAYTGQTHQMANIYSSLHQNIQDKFNEAGVEIMSPHYTQLRDGNAMAIPREHYPPGYEPSAFRVEQLAERQALGKPMAGT